MKEKGFVTIGYGNMQLDEFINLLLVTRVNYLVDIRTTPFSKYKPAFNKQNLQEALLKKGITYLWLGDSLGGRPSDDSCYFENGTVDYVKTSQTEAFKAGMEKLLDLRIPYNVAIMCTEKEPSECHRFLMVSRVLSEKGYDVTHVLGIKKYVLQKELEKKIMNIHYGENIQMTFFSDDDDILSNSYLKQSEKFAYRRKKK